MKTTTKVFLILMVVFSALAIFGGLVLGSTAKSANTQEGFSATYYYTLSGVAVLNVVLGLVALGKLRKAETARELRAIGILLIIAVLTGGVFALVAGILMVTLKDSDLHPEAASPTPEA